MCGDTRSLGASQRPWDKVTTSVLSVEPLRYVLCCQLQLYERVSLSSYWVNGESEVGAAWLFHCGGAARRGCVSSCWSLFTLHV